MSVEQIMFYVFAVLVLGSALLVVCLQNLVRSIFLFFVTIFAMAGLYVFAMADFVAVTQVVIYVGGVLVLMLFAFMLSNKELLNNLQAATGSFIKFHHILGFLVASSFLFILISVIFNADLTHLKWIQDAERMNKIQVHENTVQQIGIHTMTKYLLPFEMVSVFLMMALIGAAHLARKENKI